MNYEYPRYRLKRDPLAVVLCQVRFSKIRRMPEFMGAISDILRKEGYPEDVSGVVKQVVIGPGMTQPQIIEERRDEFRTKDNQWSVNIADSMVALVTSCYDRFKGFAERLKQVIEIIDQAAGLRHGQVHRIGLRYVDVIDPLDNETLELYLQPSLHGPTTPKSSVMLGSERMMALEAVGRTAIGVMMVRITQNNQGVVVPPDFMHKPMNHKVKVQAQRTVTLFDMDHYTEGNWDFDLPKILTSVDALHQGINAAWFNDFITEHALKTWGAERC
jgi:uncharacterized protein (TIGR04255 family)